MKKGDRPDTLRPPAPGTTEDVLLPPSRVPRFAAPALVPPAFDARSETAAAIPIPRLSAALATGPAPGEKEPRPGAERSLSSRPPPPDPRWEGGRAFFAELARSPLDAIGTAQPDPLPPDRRQRIDALVAELAGCAPEAEGPLRRRVLAFGREALPALVRAFPGALWVDLSRPHRPLRSGRQVSAAAVTLVELGDAAVPSVASLLRAPRPEVRLAACLVAADLMRGELVRPVAARLLDEVRPVRHAAVVALWAGALLSEARGLRAELVAALEDRETPVEWRCKAAWTLGQLRDAEMIPRLIEQLAAEPPLAEASRAALVRLAGRDHGRFRFGWRRWWAKHGTADRVEWLAEALTQSDAAARAKALEELVLLTGESFERYGPVETREEGRAAAERYRAWARRKR